MDDFCCKQAYIKRKGSGSGGGGGGEQRVQPTRNRRGQIIEKCKSYFQNCITSEQSRYTNLMLSAGRHEKNYYVRG